MPDTEIVPLTADVDTEAAEAALDALSGKANEFSSAFTGAMQKAITEGGRLEDVLRNLGLRLSQIALDAAFEPLEGLISSGIRNLGQSLIPTFGFAAGGVPGRITPFAAGGVVSSPTLFSMPGGNLGLMGEAGAEAILPLSRGADGRLGVASGGQGGTVQVTFNVNATDAASFVRSEAQVTAMLARATRRGTRGL